MFSLLFFFFFQAEDGIRDVAVTGVQTCALPISPRSIRFAARVSASKARSRRPWAAATGRSTSPCVRRDRKSTRLNSSHGYISYAVFCLKKKKKKKLVGQ